jgi:hypothetical protein
LLLVLGSLVCQFSHGLSGCLPSNRWEGSELHVDQRQHE